MCLLTICTTSNIGFSFVFNGETGNDFDFLNYEFTNTRKINKASLVRRLQNLTEHAERTLYDKQFRCIFKMLFFMLNIAYSCKCSVLYGGD